VVLISESVEDGFSINSVLGEDWSLRGQGRQYCPVAGDADCLRSLSGLPVRLYSATIAVGGHNV
jgi:hypothetical protein